MTEIAPARNAGPPLLTTDRLTVEVHLSMRCLPVNCVLLAGEEELILVDNCMSVTDAHELVERLRSTGKRVSSVLITHAHPDHYFGMDIIKDAFPGCRVLARPGVQETMIEWPAKIRHWAELFGTEETPLTLSMPEVLTEDHIDLEGERIDVIDVYGTECIHMSLFYVPSVKLLAAGDFVYNGIHLLTGEVHNLDQWISELERVRDGWDIELVVPGHGLPCGPDIFDDNIDYLRTLKGISRPGRRVAEVAPEITRAYPDRMLEQIPWTTRGPGYGFLGPESIGFPKDLSPVLLPPD